MSPYEKLLKEVETMKGLLITVAENMNKTQESHTATLETMKQMVVGFKSLSDRVDTVMGLIELPKKKNPNEGFVLGEEDFSDDMLHVFIGFKKPMTDEDFETMKQEVVEHYGMNISFACKVHDKLAEVYLQPMSNANE